MFIECLSQPFFAEMPGYQSTMDYCLSHSYYLHVKSKNIDMTPLHRKINGGNLTNFHHQKWVHIGVTWIVEVILCEHSVLQKFPNCFLIY